LQTVITYVAGLGGYVPLYDAKMETTVKGLYVAGDTAGIEEASTAMEEGRIAALSAVESLGLMTQQKAVSRRMEAYGRLREFRIGHSARFEIRENDPYGEREKYEQRI
jgi:hypothetical protein